MRPVVLVRILPELKVKNAQYEQAAESLIRVTLESFNTLIAVGDKIHVTNQGVLIVKERMFSFGGFGELQINYILKSNGK